MNLFEYYQQFEKNKDKGKFIDLVREKCMVRDSTVRSWIATPGSAGHRNPPAIYRPILAKITGIPEHILFKED